MSDPYVPSLRHPNPPVNNHVEVTKVLATTDPEQVSITQRRFTEATFSGKKGNNTDNTGNVNLGFNATNQPILLGPGETITIKGGEAGWPNDLSRIWIDGAVGDGVVVQFAEGIV